ncbi:sigma-70 family RNA polymerase sigma factor [Cellulosimicrobium marinum]|uniref:sigma-70 family RNA polymerase sigma factor n=1 Tax=Cellulosimicrobium marinum TaxID=1638992 RepID=UPI001E2C129C|nr:sigma-70 family RNA polymerase sigma factor [Cellulosimicrobium marinum]MCB7136182.1 sigma-70 family RNA polymerase sigma factor [Cellulosimicrobium marinum]
MYDLLEQGRSRGGGGMTELHSQIEGEALSDAELIAAVREGDSASFGALYERHAAAARTVAWQYVRSGADADDVVSDAFARTLTVLQNGGGPDVTFRAYLFTVVRRLSYDLVNGARRTQPTDDERTFESAFGPMASTEDPTLEGFERSVVARAYQDLPERWQAVLWYTEVEERTPAEIAPILGLTANGVSALAYRAREGLRQAYLQQHLTTAPAAECQGVNPLLGSFVRGGLAKRETARVEAHLDGCGECRGLVLELGDVSHGMRGVVAPLVLGVGALGLVGTALPVTGGATVAGGAAAAAAAAAAAGSGSGSGSAAGSGSAGSGSAGSGAAGSSGAGGSAGTGAAGTGAAGTGAAGGTGAAAGSTSATSASLAASSGGGAAAGTGVVGGAAAGATAAGTAATAAAGVGGAGAAAVAGAGGLVALVTSAPLAAAAVAVGVLAAAGLGVAGALGAFTPDDPTEPAPTAATSTPEPGASEAPADGSTADPAPAPTEPADDAADPTSPANVPPSDPVVADPGPTGSDGGSAAGGTTGSPSTGGSGPAPADPGSGEPPSTTPPPPPPPPAPAALDLSLGSVTLAARQPADLTVTATNSGGRAAEEVVVELTLPAGVTTASSSVVARGTSVAPALRLAALPCGDAVPQGDGGPSLVTCSLGALDPGAAHDLVVRVQADAGGEYVFAGSVRAKGVEPVRKAFRPTSVGYFGPEVRVAPEYGSGRSFAVSNPGTVAMSLRVRNAGDRLAEDPHVDFDLPAGVRLVTGSSGEQRAGDWTCRAGEGAGVVCRTDTDLSPRASTTLTVDLLAAAPGADASRHTLAVHGDAGDAHDGSTTVDLAVGAFWDDAADGLTVPAATQCQAPGEPDRASVLATYRNTTVYDDLDVRLEAAGSTATVTGVAVGDAAAVRVDDGVRFPAGSAAFVLSTTVAGQTFEHRVDAGTFDALDCWTQPRWLTAADVGVVAENVDGTVRYTATVTNGTGRALDARLLAPDTGTWSGVRDSDAVAPLRDRTSGALVLDTGLTQTTRANAVLRQYRWHADEDGDGKGYQSLLPVLLDAQSIAPAAPAPTVGQCVFDPATDTSSAPVTLRYDNTASTLPVTFSIAGRDALGRTVGAGEAASVEVPGGVGADDATFAVRADGRQLASSSVEGVDCFRWAVTGEAGSAWEPDAAQGGSVVLTGTFRNEHARTATSVVMDAGELGVTDPVEVAPGTQETFTLVVGSRDVAAGEVTFRATRLDGSQGTTAVTAAYDAVRHAPAADAAPTVGECVFDPATDTSGAPVTLHLDNSGSTVPVDFTVEGLDLARTVAAGATVDVAAPGGVGADGATYVVLADGARLAAHDVPGVDCFRWAVDGSVTSGWEVEDGAGSAVLTGTFRNDHRAATLRVALDAGALGTTDPVEVAPGAAATLTLDTRRRDVPAGEVTFRVERLDGSQGARDVVRPYDAVTYQPTWATDAKVSARWQDGAVRLVGTLTNTTAETLDARMLGGRYGDSAPVQKIAPGQKATFVIDTRSLEVKPGAVSFRQYRSVHGKGFVDTGLTAAYDGAAYVPEWDARAGASARCVDARVVLTADLRNDSSETMHVVTRTAWGTHDLGDLAPGGATSADVLTKTLSVDAGEVAFDLTRTVLGRTFSHTVVASHAAVDCTVLEPAARLELGEATYDDERDHSYRAVTLVLDNSASNVPATFTLGGDARGTWKVAAGERTTVPLDEAPWSGAAYVVQVGDWSQQLTVEPFTAAPACPQAWRAGSWYDHSASVSYRGWVWDARNDSIAVRPDGVLGWLFWDRGTRCGEG